MKHLSRLFVLSAEVNIPSTSPPFDTIMFTGNVPGVVSAGWFIFDALTTPDQNGLYTTIVDLKRLGAQKGIMPISFDVFNKAGEYKEAPDGQREVTIR